MREAQRPSSAAEDAGAARLLMGSGGAAPEEVV